MATYVHGKSAALAHGGKDITQWMSEATATMTADTGDTSHFGANAKTYIVGLNDATFSGGGLYDGAVAGIHEYFEALIATETTSEVQVPITFSPEGFVFGAAAITGVAKTTTYEVNPVVSDVVKLSFEMQANGGIRVGNVLMNQSFSTTTQGTNLDNTVSSNNGALVYVHVLANANTGNVQAILQHSTDNSTWVDLITTPVVSTGTLTAYRIGESTGLVNRHLRMRVTLAGTGSVTVLASAVRK